MSSDDFPNKPPAHLDMSQVREQARLLKKRRGWNPEAMVSEDPRDAMRRLNQAQKNEAIYEEECVECATLRTQTQDETSLCQAHLAEAMGF
jgi:hypothetical protein